MEYQKRKCPLSQRQLIDSSFMECRSMVLDVAAFLDRMDRAQEKDGTDDFRYQALIKSLELLVSKDPSRTKKILMALSDPREGLLKSRDRQNAEGAFEGDKK